MPSARSSSVGLVVLGLTACATSALDVLIDWLSEPKIAAVSATGVVLRRAPGEVGIIARYLTLADTVIGVVVER